MSTSDANHARIPILYVILGVLLVISIVPMYFYSAQVEAINRDRLKTNEMMLQNTVTRSLADDLSQHERSLHMMLANSVVRHPDCQRRRHWRQATSNPRNFVLCSKISSLPPTRIAYATLLNADAKGISAGRIAPDAFLHRELERAYSAARESREYNGQALVVGEGKSARTVFLVSYPVQYEDRFLGMIAIGRRSAIPDPAPAAKSAGGGLTPYVVDAQGRLVAAATPGFATGQDMKNLDIVHTFVERATRHSSPRPSEFTVHNGNERVEMLGTFSPVMSLNWAVVVQKPRAKPIAASIEMQRTARLLALLAVLFSILVSIFAARRITNPLESLTESSRAIARGDFSQRVNLWSRTEIGELAHTFNTMSDELEHFVEDLKRAAEENRALFMGSIQMLAGAVDEKDPYTRGHSDRVTRYSLLIAKEMNRARSFLEILRISAQLARCGQDRHRRSHSEKAWRADARRIRSHEDAHHQGRQHSAPGHAAGGNAARNRVAPRSARRTRLSLRLARRSDSVAGARDRCGRYIRRADDQSPLPASPHARAGAADHQESCRQTARSRRGCGLLAVYERGEIKIQRFTIKRPIAQPPAATAAAATAAPVSAMTPVAASPAVAPPAAPAPSKALERSPV